MTILTTEVPLRKIRPKIVISINIVPEIDSDRKQFRSKALMNILKKKEEDNKT
jgi:hypothetical protein